jgi:hypothetical protein
MKPGKSLVKPTVPHKWLFFTGGLILFLGINGTFYDLTYHITNVVDTFYQPGHLLIYSNIFGAVIVGIILFLKTRFKSLMIFGGIILGFGFVDLLWHNTFGFDSFLSPPHMILISAAILGIWSMYRKFNEIGSNGGAILSLTGLLLAITFLLLSFSMTFVRTSATVYYLMPPREIAALASFALLPAVSVMIAKLAHLSKVKFFHVTILYTICILFTTMLVNHTITLTTPLLLIGALVSGFVFDRNPKLGVIVLGVSWILVFTPYSYQIIAYVVSGKIFRVNETYYLVSFLMPYYAIASGVGMFSSMITSKILKPDFLTRKILLQNLN